MRMPAAVRTAAPTTPAVRQAEVAECGLAALAILLGFHGCHVGLEPLRRLCGDTRLGTSARTLRRLAEAYGFQLRAFRCDIDRLAAQPVPFIAHRAFIHFVVVERVDGDSLLINDPACGPVRVPLADFADDFSGVVLRLVPTAAARRQGRGFRPLAGLRDLLTGQGWGLAGAIVAGLVAGLMQIAACLALARLVADMLTPNLPATPMAATPAALAAAGALGLAALLATLGAERALQAVAARLGGRELTAGFDRLWRLPTRSLFSHAPATLAGQARLGLDLAARSDLPALVVQAVAALLALGLLCGLAPLAGSLLSALLAAETALLLRPFLRRGDPAPIQAAAVPHLAPGADIFADYGRHRLGGAEAELVAELGGRLALSLEATDRAAATHRLLHRTRPALAAARRVLSVLLAALLLAEGQMMPALLVLLLPELAAGFPARLARWEGWTPLESLLLHRRTLDQGGDTARTDYGAGGPRTPGPDIGTMEPAPLWPDGLCAESLGCTDLISGRVLFHDLTLRAAPGQQLAILGPSGSGKSVLVRRLSGLESGAGDRIRLDGVPPAMAPPGTALLLDDSWSMLPLSVRDNLCRGLTIDDDRLRAVLEEVELAADLAPRGGLDLRLHTGGAELSGGQQRRLLLAMALLRAPKLLVLDELLDRVEPALARRIRAAIRRRGILLLVVTRREEDADSYDQVIRLGPEAGHAGG